MNVVRWKDVLKKEKDFCNQTVQIHLKNSAQFDLEILEKYLEPFFESLPGDSEDGILEKFEIFIQLIAKGFFQSLLGLEKTFFSILLSVTTQFPEEKSLPLHYLTNITSKLDYKGKELFLKRILGFEQKFLKFAEWKSFLIILVWATGRPEYRELAYQNFLQLNEGTKKNLESQFKISKEVLETRFPIQTKTKDSQILFRTIPGFVLFGGSFTEMPILLGNVSQFFVKTQLETKEVFIDRFGTNLVSTELVKANPTKSSTNKFWESVLNQKVILENVSSIISDESFCLFTLKDSYNLYLFYLAN